MKHNDLWLSIPILSLLTLWLFSITNVLASAPDFLNWIKLIVLLLAPGWYLTRIIGESIELKLDEIIVLDVLISMTITMFVSIYLSFLTQITESKIIASLFIVTLVSSLICLPRLLKADMLRKKVTLLNASKFTLGLLVSFLIGFLLVIRIIPTSYWSGWDTWLNTPIVRVILQEGLNPWELVDRFQDNIGISGFYYFLTSLRASTGVELYTITRFSGPFLCGMMSVLSYLIVRRLEGARVGLLTSFFISINPFFIKRFSMTIRENFAYIFFLAILFLLVVGKQKRQKDWTTRLCYTLPIGLFLATTLVAHSLTPIIIYSVFFLQLVFFLFKDKNAYTIELTLALLLSLLLAIPYLKLLIQTFSWVISNQIIMKREIFILFTIIISFILVVFRIFYKNARMHSLKKLNFSKKQVRISVFFLFIVLLLGAFNSVLFPKTFPVLGSYNPPITLNMFSTFVLFLAVLSFIKTIRLHNIVLSIAFIILLLMNLPNVNMAIPLFRLVIYISWLLAFVAAKGLKFIYDLFYFKLKISTNLSFLGRLFTTKKATPLTLGVILLILLSPIIAADILAVSKMYSNYTPEDIDSTLDFLNLLKENDVVVPQDWTQKILHYANMDMDKVISDKELYSTNTLEKFSQIILTKYPNASRAFVFMIQKWVGRENFPVPSLELLEKWGEKYQLGSIAYYIIHLS
ncbi:hypothetical protein KAS14_05590 [Candidatus Bathyarchaeota archaeon]|nr:hypothetical protein [Candidatus Bathyarchaeota archaeon]